MEGTNAWRKFLVYVHNYYYFAFLFVYLRGGGGGGGLNAMHWGSVCELSAFLLNFRRVPIQGHEKLCYIHICEALVQWLIVLL